VRVDSQVKYGVLAKGDAEVYLRMPNPAKPDYREKIWDHAAGVIIVEEAGGKVTDINGKNLDFSAGAKLINNRGVIVTNNRVHDIIINQIKG
jgi:3'(2'), 5'-bisphosphate nucleotidase